MARGLNKVIVVGDLGRDPELRYTPEGKAVAAFSLVARRQWLTADGTPQQAEEWFNVIAWGAKAERCKQWLRKGNRVYVEGHLQTRTWVGQDHLRRVRTELVLSEMIPFAAIEPAPAADDASGTFPQHINKVMVIGLVETEPEVRPTASGKLRANFSLAASQSWVTSDGKRCETTEWFHVVTWGSLAEICRQWLSRGRRVYVEGYLHTYAWKNQLDQPHWRTELVAREMVVLDEHP